MNSLNESCYISTLFLPLERSEIFFVVKSDSSVKFSYKKGF